MSEASLSQVVADALADHLRDHGAILTSFTLCVGFVDSDGDRCVGTAAYEDQSIPETLGLLRWHLIQAESQVQDALYDDE